ncbi:MAG TPA: D-hexose-6-phosphate mutarotase [Methylophilaceae bacterium]|nr:D-hexose-6-phosphate mutarotase [Methylophilaceae bacterium]
MQTAQALSQVWEDPNLRFSEDANGLVTLEIENALATATLALQGGHLIHWQPRHADQPVLWLSKRARFVHGRSIRGGVPICWPWFGAHPSDDRLCPHGFARVMPWRLLESTVLENGATRLVLQITDTPVAHAQLPHPYELKLTVIVGETLQMSLATTNHDTEPFTIGEALHTYFQVSDIEGISVSGLEGAEYADKVKNFARDTEQGPLKFDQEFDRVYLNTQADCTIEDPGFNRRIRVKKSGSLSTVVWTPWKQKAEDLVDIGQGDDWRHMICVESANAQDNIVSVAPGTTHVLTVEYSTEAL